MRTLRPGRWCAGRTLPGFTLPSATADPGPHAATVACAPRTLLRGRVPGDKARARCARYGPGRCAQGRTLPGFTLPFATVDLSSPHRRTERSHGQQVTP